MSPMKGSSSQARERRVNEEDGVVSLCAYRRMRAVEESTEQLTGLLEELHRQAIDIHNEIIERAELSVLTELCRSCGVILDLVDRDLQAAVLTPAALYGNSGQRIFGKKPLQNWVLRKLKCPQQVRVMTALTEAEFRIVEYEPRLDGNYGQAVPLAGPWRGEPQQVAGLISRCAMASARPGVYCGWSINFEGQDFIIFAHRLDRSREVAVRDFLGAYDDLADPAVWRRAELRLLRTIIDPEGRHQSTMPNGLRRGLRLPPSRRGLLLSIRRALWRQFAEPTQGLTIHAHIAALVDDEAARAAFLDEVAEIVETVTIKSGGLPLGAQSVALDEVLRPFYTDHQGRLWCRADLRARPLSHLLLDVSTLEAMGLGEEQPIGAALEWTEKNPDHQATKIIDAAYMTYRIEQNLVATYGLCCGRDVPEPSDELSFAGRSPVLPNFKVLFDDRFLEQPLSSLPLDGADRTRLKRGLASNGHDLEVFCLGDIPGDERKLARFDGVSHATCNAVRRAILQLGLQWRSL